MEPLGSKIRQKRKAMGLTLDELAGRTDVSKPYLSLIETGRISNPPSDEKLRRLEIALGFRSNELVSQAHFERTPRDVREMLLRLLGQRQAAGSMSTSSGLPPDDAADHGERGIDLDGAFASGVLQDLVERASPNVEAVRLNAVPVINKLSAGYPEDFTDLGYPPRHADAYIGCPDVDDPDAFAARVWGDSMEPKYKADDIVVFSPAALPRNGDDCFVRFTDGTTTFKRVFFEEDETGSVIRLQPRNERYRPQTVQAEQVSGLYRAVYRLERVDG